MCPWVETLGFCPYEAAAHVWHWVQGFFAWEGGPTSGLAASRRRPADLPDVRATP